MDDDTHGAIRELLLGATIADFAGLGIDPAELDAVIVTDGIGVTYRRGLRCPCLRPESHQARIGCPACRGLGWMHPERLSEPCVVLMVNRSPDRRIIAAGEYTTGTAYATFPSEIIPGRGDILSVDGEIHVVSQVLHRAENPVSNRKLDARRDPDVQPRHVSARPYAERLLYADAQIEQLWWLDDDGAPVQGRPGAHYEFIGGEIRWRDGEGPAPGRGYSVRYCARAEYVVAQAAEPTFRQQGDNPIPYRTQVMRLDVWGTPNYREDR